MIDQPVMQAERPILPELDAPRQQPEARPVGRPRHRADAELGGIAGDPLLQLEASGRDWLDAQAPIWLLRARVAK